MWWWTSSANDGDGEERDKERWLQERMSYGNDEGEVHTKDSLHDLDELGYIHVVKRKDKGELGEDDSVNEGHLVFVFGKYVRVRKAECA